MPDPPILSSATTTTTTTIPLFSTTSWRVPGPLEIPTIWFVLINLVSLNALYALFTIRPNSILSSKQKPWIAFPFLVNLVLFPILFKCPFSFANIVISVISGSLGMRMVDLWFIQPWTKIPSRFFTRAWMDLSIEEREKRKKEYEDFFTWDKDRMLIEIWSPFRRIRPYLSLEKRILLQAQEIRTSNSNSGRGGDGHVGGGGKTWKSKSIFIPALIHNIALDILITIFVPLDLMFVKNATRWQQFGIVCGFGAATTCLVQSIQYILIMIWSYNHPTQPILNSEWTMLDTRFPCFAVSPSEFWGKLWHTMFRYLWNDLGYVPVLRFSKQYLNPRRVGRTVSKWCELVLPVMSVFFLSGVMHGYIVYATWRVAPWGQISYFLIQGLAVVMTKALARTKICIMLLDQYDKSPLQVRQRWDWFGMALMVGYHAVTAPLFVEPYARNLAWNVVKWKCILCRGLLVDA